ncbi:DUF5667 domain-containing protein [Ornithinibacillus scapharcae]|uniref:DUF5667 domain-containing protein n=1 Tax=Ornithinibacillus scapharcae TaxID=1147159 RepID=UPI000225BD37|nr:DUF5667 domain-containing protein [Ornithinibacillus scapharcae]
MEVIAEKVQLAMTFDDTAKAELISQFANERIAEANALFEAGDMEGAMELLNEALESQELALDYVTEGEGTEQSLSEEAEVIPEGEILSEHTEGKVDPTEDGDAEPTEPISEVYQELQTQFSQNITALLLAMEKVENPKAKAALAKNVEKAYAKMEKKLGKVREIEEQIASTIPDDNKVNELRNTIREDQKDFDRDMVEVEKKEGAPIVPPKSMKEKLQTSQGQETASQAKQNSQGKNTVPEKQVEKRTPTLEPKNETQASTNPAGERKNRNTNANRNDGGNSKVETEVELNKEVGEKVKSITKGNSDKGNPNKEKGNQGKGNGKDNE